MASTRAQAARSASERRYGRILVAIDFSAPSRRALEDAVELALSHGAELLLCTALRMPVPRGKAAEPTDEDGVKMDEARANAAQRLHDEARRVGLDPARYRVLVLLHDPGDEVPKAALDEDCDLIVISNRGYTGRRHYFLGSVAEKILRNARTPVLISKLP